MLLFSVMPSIFAQILAPKSSIIGKGTRLNHDNDKLFTLIYFFRNLVSHLQTI